MKAIVIAAMTAALTMVSAHAQTGTRRIDGYRCMMLDITERQSMDPNFHVTLKEAPSSSADPAGWAASIVIVREPAQPQNGFLQVLKPNGQTAWIDAREVKPYRPVSEPSAHCFPAFLPNGRIGTTPG